LSFWKIKQNIEDVNGGSTLITIAKQEESAEILEIDRKVFGNYSRKKYLQEAIMENKCLVAKDNSSIVGFLIYDTHFFECSFISLLIVHPSERQKGYAKSLMKYFETISPTQKIFSSTNKSNEKMHRLFSSIGYVKSGIVENLDEDDPEIIYYKKLY
jgi:ribosomal protein S18 acetylase RimI-like enzyme